MKTKQFLLLTFLSLLIISCGGQETEDSLGGMDNANQNDMLQDVEEYSENEEEDVSIDRKLIKTAYVGFEVESMSKTEVRIRNAAIDLDGYITNENQYDSEGRKNFSMEIKVPSSNFREMMFEIAEGVDEFESRSVDVQDVTEEFIDVEARIKTKKEVEQRYVALLQQAYTVEEVLLIEDQLRVLREEIESFEGRLKYLKQSVSYSTIHVTFFQEVPVNSRFGERFGDSFVNGWNGFVYFLILLTQLWPFILVAFGVIGYYRWNKKKKLTTK